MGWLEKIHSVLFLSLCKRVSPFSFRKRRQDLHVSIPFPLFSCTLCIEVLRGKFTRTYDGYNKPFETYFVATGLVPGRTYRSYVRGLNLVGAGPDSDVELP